jgi:hypothetical protein
MKALDTIRRFRAEFEDIPLAATQAMLVAHVLLSQLADASDFAQLADGKRLRDGIDFTAWLRELEACVALQNEAEQRREKIGIEVKPELQLVGKYCHACGHVHQDRECGKDMGGAGVCKCDVEVVA